MTNPSLPLHHSPCSFMRSALKIWVILSRGSLRCESNQETWNSHVNFFFVCKSHVGSSSDANTVCSEHNSISLVTTLHSSSFSSRSKYRPRSWSEAEKHKPLWEVWGVLLPLLCALLVTVRRVGEALQGVHHLPLIPIPVSDHRGLGGLRWRARLFTDARVRVRRQIAEVTGSPGDGDGCVFGLEGRQAWSLSLSLQRGLSSARPLTRT